MKLHHSKNNEIGRGLKCLVLILSIILISFSSAWSAVFTVNSDNDTDDSLCNVSHCSLREAINAANTNSGKDTIEFNITGPGPNTIQPNSAFPTITDPVIIDGYTQHGASPNTNPPSLGSNAVLMIELDGTNAGNIEGLRITAGNSTVRGLVINRFRSGIALNTNGGNIIEGNYIGTDVTGGIVLANTGNGVGVSNSSLNIIGGTTPAARNIISGNGIDGVHFDVVNTTQNQVQGNLIGTDATGTIELGNSRVGVIVGGSNNIIGGTTDEARNIISGNNSRGILIEGRSTGNLVQGNFVGTDVTGTIDIGNSDTGVVIAHSSGNIIGGTIPGAGNLISGNDYNGVIIEGILAPPELFTTEDNLVQGNLIGTDVTGNFNLGNSADGILFRFGSEGRVRNNTVGGTEPGAGNTIAFNGLAGVFVGSGVSNDILSNTIFFNSGLGIDIGGRGVTLNDPGDSDTGANYLQNFPVLTKATSDGNVTIEGTFNSTPNTDFLLEFFANTECDPTGFGEG
jgi:CSLREA domain-containing protein